MKILYLGFAREYASVDAVYVRGLRENGAETFYYSLYNIFGFKRYQLIIRYYFKHRKEIDIIFAGYESPQIVVFLSFFCRKKIIYNAFCSVYERLIVSRKLAKKISFKSIYYWLLDFLACHLAYVTMLETERQVQYFEKLFKVSAKKLYRALIGVDDKKFFYNPQIKKFERFTVLFRGRLLPEAGGDLVVRAAKILERELIDFLMLANGMELGSVQKIVSELCPKNLKLVTEYLPDEKLLEIMQKSHLSLGQLSDHPRLQRTIPHKAYESLALCLPYLTARNPGVMELFKEGETCLAFAPNNPKDLADKILWAYEHQEELKKISENGYALFQNDLTSKKLVEKLLQNLLAM